VLSAGARNGVFSSRATGLVVVPAGKPCAGKIHGFDAAAVPWQTLADLL